MIKTLILILTMMVVGNAMAEELALEMPLLCIAEYFTHHEFATALDPEDPEDEGWRYITKVLGVNPPNSSRDNTKFLVSANGVQAFGGIKLFDQCKTHHRIVCRDVRSGWKDQSFMIRRRSGVFLMTFWGMDPEKMRTTFQTLSGTCAQLPVTEDKKGP